MFSNIKKFFEPDMKTETPKTTTPEEKWVWVEGYKGTDSNMCCQGFQYEIGSKYSMAYDDVEECCSGFHLCLTLEDVFNYYHVGDNHRFFKVRALVQKNDMDEYGYIHRKFRDAGYCFSQDRRRDKLAAASIEFIEELNIDEVLSHTEASDWPDEYKKMAIEHSIRYAYRTMYMNDLVDLGYSAAFADYIIDLGKAHIAKAVGSQRDLSMDMKVLMIING